MDKRIVQGKFVPDWHIAVQYSLHLNREIDCNRVRIMPFAHTLFTSDRTQATFWFKQRITTIDSKDASKVDIIEHMITMEGIRTHHGIEYITGDWILKVTRLMKLGIVIMDKYDVKVVSGIKIKEVSNMKIYFVDPENPMGTGIVHEIPDTGLSFCKFNIEYDTWHTVR